MTELQKRILQARRREERRAAGLCIDCGEPVINKLDGTPASRCKTHFRTNSNRTGRDIESMREDPDAGSGGHFDQDDFKAYTDRVADAVDEIHARNIAELPSWIGGVAAASADGVVDLAAAKDPKLGGVSVRQIHEHLGDAARPHWTADALWMAKVARRVRHGDTFPTKWFPVSPSSALMSSTDGVDLSSDTRDEQPPTTAGTTFAAADQECPPAEPVQELLFMRAAA